MLKIDRNRLLVLFALISLAVMAFVVSGPLELVQRVTSEDNLVENATVLAFAFGAFAAGFSLWRRQYVLFSAVWLLLCVLFVGEETSWFQRHLGYSVPAIESLNSQNEFNFHNLNFIHGTSERSFIGDDGELRLSWQRLLSSQSLFRIGFLSYFLILPLLLLASWPQRIAKYFNLPPFDSTQLVVIWALIFVTVPLTLLIEPGRRLAIAETREFLYAMAIALYTFGFARLGHSLKRLS